MIKLMFNIESNNDIIQHMLAAYVPPPLIVDGNVSMEEIQKVAQRLADDIKKHVQTICNLNDETINVHYTIQTNHFLIRLFIDGEVRTYPLSIITPELFHEMITYMDHDVLIQLYQRIPDEEIREDMIFALYTLQQGPEEAGRVYKLACKKMQEKQSTRYLNTDGTR